MSEELLAKIVEETIALKKRLRALETFVYPQASSDADTLDGQHGDYYLNASNINAGTLNSQRLPSDVDAATLAAQEASYYLNASNIDAGTLALARLPTGIDAATVNGEEVGKITPFYARYQTSQSYTKQSWTSSSCSVDVPVVADDSVIAWATIEWKIDLSRSHAADFRMSIGGEAGYLFAMPSGFNDYYMNVVVMYARVATAEATWTVCPQVYCNEAGRTIKTRTIELAALRFRNC